MSAISMPIPDEPKAVPAPAQSLGRRFIDLLLADAARSTTVVPAADPVFELDDLEEFGAMPGTDEVSETEKVHLTVDVAAAAVLLASAFETEPGILRALRTGAPAIIVHLPSESFLDATKHVLKVCAFGRATRIIQETATPPRLMNLQADKRAAVVLSCDEVKSGRNSLDEWSLAALSLALPTCFLSADPQRVVPQRVRAVADHVLQFGRWTGNALALAIEAVAGSPVDVPQGSWIAGVGIDDLKASVSRRRGGPGSLERLRWIVEKRHALSHALPRLEDLSGYGDARRIGLDLIADLQAYGRGEIGWRDLDRGMLLAGPPGVGKSFFARVFAHSAGLPLVSASLAQWQATGHLGDLLKAMKRSFAEARAAAPCVLFIDELDSIGDRATFHHRHRDYSTQVVNGLLEALDGAADREGVVVLGATNHAHNIDPAVVRPGRFDRVVHIGLPDPRELAGILRTCLGSDLSAVDLMPIARAGSGGSGANAASWVRQARGVARRAGRELRVEDLMETVRKDRAELSSSDLHRCAVHEAAHACAVRALGLGKVESLTLNDVGGNTRLVLNNEVTTTHYALRDIVGVLSGRAAEIVVVGNASAGAGGPASSDLAKATKLAMACELSWGLGQTGPLWLGDPNDGLSMFGSPPGSIDAVRRLLRHAEAEAERLVRSMRPAIERLASKLMDAGYLVEEEISPLLADIAPFEIRPCASPVPARSCSAD